MKTHCWGRSQALAFACLALLASSGVRADCSRVDYGGGVRVETTGGEDSGIVEVTLFYDGRGPQMCEFSFEVEGMRAETVNRSFPLLTPSRVVLMRAWPGRSAWSYHWGGECHVGDQTAQHDDQVVYRLPYRSGERYAVSQSYEDPFSHVGSNRFAVDFALPEGTPVLAARGGTVVQIKSDSISRCDGEDNHVLIKHRDGTVAAYRHLLHEGVRVEEGERVRVGDNIGRSGNTGGSTAPHLHFHVATPLPPNSPQAFKTFPIRFLTARGVLAQLEEGRHYEAP